MCYHTTYHILGLIKCADMRQRGARVISCDFMWDWRGKVELAAYLPTNQGDSA